MSPFTVETWSVRAEVFERDRTGPDTFDRGLGAQVGRFDVACRYDRDLSCRWDDDRYHAVVARTQSILVVRRDVNRCTIFARSNRCPRAERTIVRTCPKARVDLDGFANHDREIGIADIDDQHGMCPNSEMPVRTILD